MWAGDNPGAMGNTRFLLSDIHRLPAGSKITMDCNLSEFRKNLVTVTLDLLKKCQKLYPKKENKTISVMILYG